MSDIPDQAKAKILAMVYKQQGTYPFVPVDLVDVHLLTFFILYDNDFDGWLATVIYPDKHYTSDWFIALTEEGWYVEPWPR